MRAGPSGPTLPRPKPPRNNTVEQTPGKRRYAPIGMARITRSRSAELSDRDGRNAQLALDRLGVEVVSVREPWLDMGGPVRTLLIAILSWVAEEERRQIASRSKLGVERARREGKRIGRPPVSIDIELAGRLKEDGLSVREIAKRLGVSRSVVHRVLQAVPEVPQELELVQVPISAGIGAC